MDTTHSIIRFAKRFFLGTACSRVSGAFRDIAMAFCFGSAPEVGAFMVAYRFANLFRRLFGEGNIQSGFIPHFSSLPQEKARHFYRDTVFSLFSLLCVAVICIEGACFYTANWLQADWREILLLAMRMVPGLIFICLYALNSAFLQFHRQYFISAVAPVMFNLAWIVMAFWGRYFPFQTAMRFLAAGISIGFAMQWMMTSIQVGKVLQMPLYVWIRPKLFSKDFRKMLQVIGLSVLGIAAVQINSALDAVFARIADPSGPAYLWYAIRLQQLPLALFGIALSGALLPSLSRAMTEGFQEKYISLLRGALKSSLALLIPCTFALICLGKVGVNLLYGHGDFQKADIYATTNCLIGYSFGLVPSICTLLLTTSFYARKIYTIPVFASLSSIFIHILLNTLFVFGFGLKAMSVALSTSISSTLNCLFLLYFFQKDLQIPLFSGMGKFCLQVVMISLISYINTSVFHLWLVDLPQSIMEQSIQFTLLTSVFLGSFALMSYWTKFKEVWNLFRA